MIYTHLDLSTSHVTLETMKQLSHLGVAGDCATGDCSDARIQAAGWPAMTIAAYDRGCFVSVPSFFTDEQRDAVPEDLRYVFRHAQAYGATLIRLDSDGATLEALPTYDW